MGREQDLLDAARTGNVANIEKLLSNRSRKSSGGGALTSALASLWNLKAVNINCTDASGETPLHLAALNGHREIVSILLQSESNISAVDTRGCTPLHLAAWGGHSDICYMLLNPSTQLTLSTVNMQNGDGDTSLHCAAQHGHSSTVAILLQNKADPSIRNLGDLTPLELAAQYGRLDVVHHLINTHPGLVHHIVPTHTPLHLASRSGHKAVVEYLLNSGIQVNLKTDAGTALHEAATYCKVDVIQLLLERGIDMTIRDKESLTAEDILKTLPSQKAQHARQLIENYSSNHLSAFTTVHTPDSDAAFSGAETPQTSPIKKPSPLQQTSIYQPVEDLYTKPFKDKGTINDDSDSDRYLGAESPPPPVPPRIPSIKTSKSPLSVSTSTVDTCSRTSSYDTLPTPTAPKTGYIPMGVVFPDGPPACMKVEHPKKPPRHKKSTSPNPDTMSAKSISSSLKSDELSVSTTDSLERSADSEMKISDYILAKDSSYEKSETCAEPEDLYANADVIAKCASPDKLSNNNEQISSAYNTKKNFPNYCNVTIISSNKLDISDSPDSSKETQETIPTLTSEPQNLDNSLQLEDQESSVEKELPKDDKPPLPNDNAEPCQDVETSDKTTLKVIPPEDSLPTEIPSPIALDDLKITKEIQATVIQTDNDQSNNENVGDRNSTGKPSSLDLDIANKRISTLTSGDIPISPTGYKQPPTPDQPPPSPSTALLGIQQKINPQEKRKSKDMETLTDAAMIHPGTLTDIPELNKEQATPNNNHKEVGFPSDCDQTIEITSTGDKIVIKTYDTCDKPIKGKNSLPIEPDQYKLTKGDNLSEFLVKDDSKVTMRRQISSTSTCSSDSELELNVFAGLLRGSAPGGSRSVVSQICENVVVKRIKSNRRSAPSSFFTFDPLMEKEEEKEIDTEEVIAAIDALETKHNTSNTKSSKSDDSSVFDDAEEWNKIEEIVSSYGGRFSLHGDYALFEAHMDRILSNKGSNSIHGVGEWLEMIKLGQYENTLIANGFDDTDFLGSNILEDSEIEAIGIKDILHRKRILDSSKLLPPLKPIDQNNLPTSVEDWLKSLRLEHYYDTFKSHGYDSMNRVVKLWELELSTVLDISSVGHRRRILASLGDRPTVDKKEPTLQTPILIIDHTEEVSSPFEHIDLYKDYTGVKSRLSDDGEDTPSQNSLVMTDGQDSDESSKQSQSIKDSTIHIRPPHLAHTTGSIRHWRHRPEVLIKGCCNYTSQYLGSTLVKELNGPESTQAGIAKLKKSSDVIAKIPTIMLSISYRGVKFIDAKSKKVICDHEIANIFCACQDAEHMNFFAYITKDRETAKHYCHVFSVRSLELAGEIILTLGEAFEIAYQMALKEKAEEDAFEFELKLSQSDIDDSTSISSKASISTV